MQIQFLDALPAPAPRLVARLVNEDAVPADLEPMLAEAARMARFAGKPGQTFEGFAERGEQVVRVALAGIGKPAAEDRRTTLEKAGAGLVARYLTSGETQLALDMGGSGLSAEEAASVLLGAKLRGWRHDVYRTKLADDKKPTLVDILVTGAPEGTQAAWEVEQAVAIGTEFARELVTEPGNAIFPESFVERCQARMLGTGITVRTAVRSAQAAGRRARARTCVAVPGAK